MKRLSIILLALMVGLFLTVSAFAESGTKEECIAKSKEAAQMITDEGLEAATAEINKKDGKFVWKDTYVFLMDLDGNMLAHPIKPSLIGKNLLATPDTAGKLLFQDFVDVAKNNGEGWVDYMWAKPGADTPQKKITYIYRVPEQNLLVGAGIYE
ncbi:MAG: cache domain-containing protein [Deltaproteobacteria bacterium]|nr:cache domain-containing protein [Deltaproteobacteria bacterium]